MSRKIFRAGKKNWFLAAVAVVLTLAIILYLIFQAIPYYGIFLFVNFFFLYVEIVYLLKFKEKQTQISIDHFPSLSVIVPVYNSAKTLERSIKAIKSLNYPKRLEIIVIEDNSTDESASILKKFTGLNIITTKKNLGKAASLNLGLRIAKGELIATIDSDTFPSKDSVEKMVKLFSEKQIGAVVALICTDKPKNFLQQIQEVEYFVGNGFTQASYDKLESVFITPGPLSIYRKDALLKVGGFDEDNIAEDMEIGLKLKAYGYRVISTMDAVAYTDTPDTLRRLYRQRIRWFRGAIYNGKKYFFMLFNRKYGTFGKFVFPVTYLIQLFSITVIARLLTLYLEGIIGFLAVLFNVISVPSHVLADTMALFFLRFETTIIFSISTLLVWGYVIFTSFELAKRKMEKRHLLPIFIFMTVYPFCLSIIYFISFIKEVSSSESKW
ncbi:glycosyltransferase family 2 protein [Candidatus Micrarchaeota archaeon]|nr:glycosyltransferase family 2 protein [Candidatus Micrarchaeota archaeon]